MICKAVSTGRVKCRGKSTIEWYMEDGEPQRYCYGYIDKMTDALLPVCRDCHCHVDKAQGDFAAYFRGKEQNG